MTESSTKNDVKKPDPRRDQQLIEVIQQLREDIPTTLQPEEARRLNASLAQHLSRAKQPKNRSQSVQKAVERIEEYPQIRGLFSEILDRSVSWYEKPSSTGYISIAGDLFDIEPGNLMVCPNDPQHYQRYRRNARQKLICPHHHVDLIPVETAPPLEEP
jgi:hypothetical protein